jgi:hypothetical protein
VTLGVKSRNSLTLANGALSANPDKKAKSECAIEAKGKGQRTVTDAADVQNRPGLVPDAASAKHSQLITLKALTRTWIKVINSSVKQL